jgi:hypothetical protein
MGGNNMSKQVFTTRRRLLVAAGALGLAAVLVGAGGAATAADAPVMTAAPTISGSAAQGATLTASSGSWSGTAPISFAYQWRRCDANGSNCSNVSGATGQTRVVSADAVGKTLRVQVTATNSAGSASGASASTAVVTASKQPAAGGQPSVTGSLQVGSTLTVGTGTWTGSTPMTYSFAWQRCDGSACQFIAQATHQTYVATVTDIGKRLRAQVTARNAVGTGTIFSNVTAGSITAPGTSPVSTAAPSIVGKLEQGQTITANAGSWRSQTTPTFRYAWLRCDANGANCVAIASQTSASYTLSSADVGHTLRTQVTATNSSGSSTVTSNATGLAAKQATDLIRLPSGTYSVPADQVSLPQRLIISNVSFSPSRLRSRAPFTARVRVTDTRGYAVRDALVYVIGLPYSRLAGAPEVRTDTAGYATVRLQPTRKMPLSRGSALVMFVRARNQTDNLLAGVATRRLVQVLVGR